MSSTFVPSSTNACINTKDGVAIALTGGGAIKLQLGTKNPKAVDTPAIDALGVKGKSNAEGKRRPDRMKINVPDATTVGKDLEKQGKAAAKSLAKAATKCVEDVIAANVLPPKQMKELKSFLDKNGKLLPIDVVSPLNDAGELWLSMRHGNKVKYYALRGYGDTAKKFTKDDHLQHVPYEDFNIHFLNAVADGALIKLAPNKKKLRLEMNFKALMMVTTERGVDMGATAEVDEMNAFFDDSDAEEEADAEGEESAGEQS